MYEEVEEGLVMGNAQASPLLLVSAAYSSSGERDIVKMVAKHHGETNK